MSALRAIAGGSKAIVCAALPVLLAAPPSAHPAAAATARTGNVVMGTVLQVTVVHRNADRARELAAECIRIARHWDDVLTTWRPDGELARLNAKAGDGPIGISGDLQRALSDMLRLSAQTGGIFDPAVGPLVRAVREGSNAADLPSSSALRIATALELAEGVAELERGAQLDAGGIGKGIALDAITSHLRATDATGWYLDFGGSSQSAHRGQGQDPWRVAVAGLETGDVRGTIDLSHGSLSTSRALLAGDDAGSIVDPRTATYVPPPVLATVYAPDATTAEAWSTALVVLGADGVAKAEQAGVEARVETAGRIVTSGKFPLVEADSAFDPRISPDAR